MLDAHLNDCETTRLVTLNSEIRKLGGLFERAGLASPQLDARLLVAAACELSAEDAILKHDMELTRGVTEAVAAFAARRLEGEPVSRIIGRREFWGLTFSISDATLDPRPETELLVEAVLRHVTERNLRQTPLLIADLGTGSGCILAALLSELPLGGGVAADRSEAALSVARDNLSKLGLLDRSLLLCGSWLNAIGGAQFDIVVSNPPYIESDFIGALEPEVRRHDPRLALDGGEDGLDAYRVILPQALVALRRGGLLVLETGYQQAEEVLSLMKQTSTGAGYCEVRILRDLSGAQRAVAGVRQS